MWSIAYLIGALPCTDKDFLGRTCWDSEEGIIALLVKEQGEFMEFYLRKDDEPDKIA